mmetsp:Transcript_34836/g.42022  ORF Transcript_34836/g.42022 Transcript_34836/m.42022 type:complete len:116 (+) Transcript_34836:61-408(+)
MMSTKTLSLFAYVAVLLISQSAAFITHPSSLTLATRNLNPLPKKQSLALHLAEPKILIKAPEIPRGEDGLARVPLPPFIFAGLAFFASTTYKMRENKEKMAKKAAARAAEEDGGK